MAKPPEPKKPEAPPAGFLPVDLRINVTVTKDDKVESCCNYDITGRSGNLLLVLPPMTHIQDMPR